MLRKILIGVSIMAMATTAALTGAQENLSGKAFEVISNIPVKRPPRIQAKIDEITAKQESKVEPKRPGVNIVRAAKGDMVLIHDGSSVIMIKEIDPLEKMSVPASRTVFVGNAGQITAEIKKLGLKE